MILLRSNESPYDHVTVETLGDRWRVEEISRTAVKKLLETMMTPTSLCPVYVEKVVCDQKAVTWES